MRGNKFYEAYHLLRDVCARRPGANVVCATAMEAIVRANRPEEALRFLREQAPQMQADTSHAAQYWHARGRVAAQQERQEDALEAFRRAHGFAPAEPEIALSLAATSAALGLRDEARALVEEVLAKLPNSPTARRLSVELERETHRAIGNSRSTDPTPTTLEP
jgi:predicted Zn-dependent protease